MDAKEKKEREERIRELFEYVFSQNPSKMTIPEKEQFKAILSELWHEMEVLRPEITKEKMSDILYTSSFPLDKWKTSKKEV